MIAAASLCAVAVVALIHAERVGNTTLRTLAKIVASGAFLVVGWQAYRGGDFGRWVSIGLVLGAIGDICLLGKSTRSFLAGLVAFLAGHAAYIVAAAQASPVGSWVRPTAIIPLFAAALALRWLWPHLSGRTRVPGTMRSERKPSPLRGPVLAYVATITLMVVGALAVPCRWFTLGAILFFVSDLAVAREKFVEKGLSNKLVGLPTYYAGQLLIAWSMAYVATT